jgi:hypothetical protein
MSECAIKVVELYRVDPMWMGRMLDIKVGNCIIEVLFSESLLNIISYGFIDYFCFTSRVSNFITYLKARLNVLTIITWNFIKSKL